MIANRHRCLLAVLAAGTLGIALAGCGGSSSGKASSSSSTTGTASTSTGTSATATTSTQSSSASLTATASSGKGRTASASAGGVTATMHGSTHAPKVERAWPLHFTVTRAGRAVKASVSYEYLFGEQVVAHRSHYSFDGRFSDVFKWPAAAVGYPLTFRAVIVSEGATINLDYPVQVSR